MPKEKLPLSYIEISKNNLIHNIKEFRNLVSRETKISVVIKGNAYGHEQNIVAKILEPYVDNFFINSVEELQLLRKVSEKPVLLLGCVQRADLEQAIKLGCILAIFSLEQLMELNRTTQRIKIKQEIHIPFDAYLGREGFLLKELSKLFEQLKRCKYIKVGGMYAHFANIEDTPNLTHARKQIREYEKAFALAEQFGFHSLQTHISASSGILAYEKNAGINSIVRLGLSVYGMWPSENLRTMYKNSQLKLKSVLSWKTKIAQVKILPEGHSIGYGLTYVTKKKTKIALIPQGYADGFDRGLSNKGEVLIRGTKCKVLGRVSMNMFTVDVSHLPQVKSEDEVVIIGKQGGEQITAEEVAKKLGTINYEVTARISSLLPRVVV